ncbi:hypothetical protein Cni_G16748 [Canna indica]|uniref:Uncharacterized protein n=1 Tax=Canna indica TaxID=4628 RepID=A0AAQ3KLD8_9LILI|nr:hypothetical protein Cni_G16748 [Canna indica]
MASLVRSKGFVHALQELKNLRPQLYSAAEYYKKSYLHSEQKQIEEHKGQSRWVLVESTGDNLVRSSWRAQRTSLARSSWRAQRMKEVLLGLREVHRRRKEKDKRDKKKDVGEERDTCVRRQTEDDDRKLEMVLRIGFYEIIKLGMPHMLPLMRMIMQNKLEKKNGKLQMTLLTDS